MGIRMEQTADITLSCDEQLSLTADRFHLRNLLATLIDNALKYTDKRPQIHLSAEQQEESVVLTISDNGHGIAREHLEHLFEKFYRVPQGDVQSVRGYGLGLYYARQVAERHHGTLTVESRVGVGSTFTLKLPANG